MTEFFVGMRVVDLMYSRSGTIVEMMLAKEVSPEMETFAGHGEYAYLIEFDDPRQPIECTDLDGREEVVGSYIRNVWAFKDEMEPISPLVQLAEVVDD